MKFESGYAKLIEYKWMIHLNMAKMLSGTCTDCVPVFLQSHVASGKQLVHSRYLQCLATMAVGLDLDAILCYLAQPRHHSTVDGKYTAFICSVWSPWLLGWTWMPYRVTWHSHDTTVQWMVSTQPLSAVYGHHGCWAGPGCHTVLPGTAMTSQHSGW